MIDEQPNTTSAASQPTDATASTQVSETQDQPAESPHWWRRMFNRRGDEGQQTEDKGAETGSDDGASQPLTVTQKELERRIQSEVDRRESKRATDNKTQKRRELRDSDPWAYAEEDRKSEQLEQGNQSLEQLFSTIGTEHDRISIDPLVELLPKPERERIMGLEGAGKGLDGRRLIVTEAAKALEKHWRAEGAKDAEAKLRKNPVFRKQVFAELRGGSPEPVLLPSGGASEADQTVSALLRNYYHLG